MGDKDIQGTVTDAEGNPVPGAVVALWDQDDPNQVITTTADSNGNYIFSEHPDGDGTATNWHVAARDPGDETRQFSSLHSVSSQLSLDLPDSVVDRWPIQEDTFPLANTERNADLTAIGGATLENDAGSIEGKRVLFDGTDDGAETTAACPTGSRTLLATVETTETVSKRATICEYVAGSASAAAGETELRFEGNFQSDRLLAAVGNDSGNAQQVDVDGAITTGQKHRIGLVLDATAGELDIVVDATRVASGTVSGSFSAQVSDYYLGNDGAAGRFLPAYVDEPLTADEAYSDTQLQDDLNRQPWS